MYKLTFKFLYVLCAQLDLNFGRESGIIFVYSKAVSSGHEPLAEPFRMPGLEPFGVGGHGDSGMLGAVSLVVEWVGVESVGVEFVGEELVVLEWECAESEGAE